MRVWLVLFIVFLCSVIPVSSLLTCSVDSDCPTNECSGTAVCAGVTCQYVGELQAGSDCLGGLGECKQGAESMECGLKECSKPNRLTCGTGSTCSTAPGGVDQSTSGCCAVSENGNRCVPQVGQQCFGSNPPYSDSVFSNAIGAPQAGCGNDAAPNCYGVWVKVVCHDTDNAATSIAGYDLNSVYFQAVSGLPESTLSDFVDQSALSTDTEVDVRNAGLTFYIGAYTKAQQIIQGNKDAYNNVLNTLIQQAGQDFNQNNPFCGCEGSYTYEVRVVQPHPMYQLKGVVAGLMSALFAMGFEDISDVMLAGGLVEWDLENKYQNQCIASTSIPGMSEFQEIESFENIMVVLAACDQSGLAQCVAFAQLLSSLQGGVLLGPLLQNGNAMIPDQSYLQGGQMGLTVNYDAPNMKNACENAECAGGVYDTSVTSNMCCGDDLSDDPDSSQLFCEGCRLGNLGSSAGNRAWLSAKSGSGGMCCGDDLGSIKQGNAGGSNDCSYLIDGDSLGWGFENLCWLDSLNLTAKWLKAQRQGFISYLDCAGISVLADGDSFIGCGKFSGDMFDGKADPFANDGLIRNSNQFVVAEQGNSQYFCYNTSKGKNAIAYCGKDSWPVTEGGLKLEEGGNVVFGDATYYCAHFSEPNHWNFTIDLDHLAERGDPDGSSCDEATLADGITSAGLAWTGSKCCGEADDAPYEESYTEKVRNNYGACYRNVYQPNEDSQKQRTDGKDTDGFLYADLIDPLSGDVLEELHKFDEVYVFNGTFLGCAIGDELASDFGRKSSFFEGSLQGWNLTNDEILFDAHNANYPNPGGDGVGTPGGLIADMPYCTLTGKVDNKSSVPKTDFYCSYEEVWKETKGKNLTHLTRTPTSWALSSDELPAECCAVSECWDGNQCVASVHDDPHALPVHGNATHGWRCVLGEWISSEIKYTWDGKAAGFCGKQSQCLVDPDGNVDSGEQPQLYGGDTYQNNPICINASSYIQDHYCEGGNWTTRTKLLGLEMLREEQPPFELFCDSYDHALTYLSYNPGGRSLVPLASGLTLGDVFIGAYPAAGCTDASNTSIPCANHFCVLVDPEKVVVGVSLNKDIAQANYNMLEVFGASATHCNMTNASLDTFQLCSSDTSAKGKTYYSPSLKALLFSKDKELSVEQRRVSYGTLFFNLLFKDLLQPMIDALVNRGLPEDYSFFSYQSKDANRIYYAATADEKKIFAIREEKFNKPEAEGGKLSAFFTVDFIGFDAAVCDAFTQNAYNMSCFKDVGQNGVSLYRVSAPPTSQPSSLDVPWIDTTARLRPNGMMQGLQQP